MTSTKLERLPPVLLNSMVRVTRAAGMEGARHSGKGFPFFCGTSPCASNSKLGEIVVKNLLPPYQGDFMGIKALREFARGDKCIYQ